MNLYYWETLFLWIAVFFYAVAAIGFGVSIHFQKEKALTAGSYASLAVLVPHGISIALRWIQAGRGPYLGYYEITTSVTWIAAAFYAWLVWRHPRFRPAGVFVMPLLLLGIGVAVMSGREIQQLPVTFRTYWLTIHVLFAKVSVGACAVSSALGASLLLKERAARTRPGGLTDRLLPPQAQLDELSYKFLAFGFTFIGVMIGAGAIWANQVWGRYWGWDPIETWSLVAWLLYGVYLHLRVAHGWRGRRAAWLGFAALFVLIFALWGSVLIYHSIHSEYITG